MNCLQEYNIHDIQCVSAIPAGSLTLAAAAILLPVIQSSQMTITENGIISIGVPLVSFVFEGTILHNTGEFDCKDSESDAISGRSHTVSVSCSVDVRSSSSRAHLRALEDGPYCLLLHFRGGNMGLIMSDVDSYDCSVEYSKSTPTVSFKIHNLAGVQLVERAQT